MNEIEIRLSKPSDDDFIYSTWLRSYRFASQFAKKISNEIYYKWHHIAIDNIKNRGGKIYVAHLKGEPDVILGFLCVEQQPENVIHYCYVKKPFRKMKIARSLFEASKISLENALFTHYTPDADWATKKFPTLSYDPYRL